MHDAIIRDVVLIIHKTRIFVVSGGAYLRMCFFKGNDFRKFLIYVTGVIIFVFYFGFVLNDLSNLRKYATIKFVDEISVTKETIFGYILDVIFMAFLVKKLMYTISIINI